MNTIDEGVKENRSHSERVRAIPIPNDLKSFLVYKFICASCSSSYIGDACRYFKTRIEEHIKKDNKSHIF